MIFTKITQEEVLLNITKVGTRALTFNYVSGYSRTITDIIWSTVKFRDDYLEPTAGYVNFFQNGSVSGSGIYGGEVSTTSPLTMDGTVYTDISTLTTHLLTVLNSLN
jgi:hypothetical protein